MKKIIFTAAILLSCLSFKIANAQVRFSVGVNIGVQPEWGPVGYDHADYYYMPDIGVYYDVPAHQYVYLNNNVWIRSGYLPPRYSNYDIYHGYKVVINRPQPWRYDNDYRVRYNNYRGRRDQGVIRDSRDERYRNHWHEDNGRHGGRGPQEHQDNGNHGDRGRGHGDGGGDRGHGDGGGDRGHGNRDGGGDKGHGHGHDN
ncbi:MAG: hypothetical protein ACXVB0_06070 [Mucilaginibacter sp.]